MAKVLGFLEQTLRLMGVLEAGEPADGNDAEDLLGYLNQFIEELATQNLTIPVVVRVEYPLTSGTATYTLGPAAGVAIMVESILKDKKRVIPSAIYTQGDYGYQDLFIGLPAVLGRNGVERVIEMQLNESERAMLDHSANAVRSVVEVLGY